VVRGVLGIDLGTTESIVAHIRRGEPECVPNLRQQQSTPSTVALGRHGELLVGEIAQTRRDNISSVSRFLGHSFVSPESQAERDRAPYRVTEGTDGDVAVWLGDRAYRPTEIISLILGQLKAAAEHRIGSEFPRAVIAVPNGFGERQNAAIRDAGRLAGFHVLTVLDEATAAVLGSSYVADTGDEHRTTLVVDLRCASFNLAVVTSVSGTLTVLSAGGDDLLGGREFDRLLCDHIFAIIREEYGQDLSDVHAKSMVRAFVETVPAGLAAAEKVEGLFPTVGTSGLEVELSREEYTAAIRSGVSWAMEAVSRVLADARCEPADLSEVLLIGHSTSILHLESALVEMFGQSKISKDEQPLTIVARGAAIRGALINDVECPHCKTLSRIRDDDCLGCGRPLALPRKVVCSICFLYSDVGAEACAKCAAILPSCEAENTPAASTDGGLQCPRCLWINHSGAATCGACGESFMMPVEITPRDLCIELPDGSTAVIIPKGTTFPTDQPIVRDFFADVANRRTLEIAVLERVGSDHNNHELLGYLTLNLPPDLPHRSRISISLGLDASRTLVAYARFPDSNSPASQRLSITNKQAALSQQGYKYDIAISFAGRDRETAELISTRLKAAGLRVFYDRDYQYALLGEDLAEVLQSTYFEKSRFAIAIVSQAFLASDWARNCELRAILARMKQQRTGYVLPYVLEEVSVPGLNPTIGYVSAKTYTPIEFADLVVMKIRNQPS
jgi:molecular chaperone DnaK